MKKPIGYISYTHGLDGKVKIVPMIPNYEFKDILDNNTQIYILANKNNKEYEIIDLIFFAFTGKIFLCKITGVSHIEEAQKFTKKEIFIDIVGEDFIDAENLINFNVYNQNNEYIGQVIDCGDYGAGMLIEVANVVNNKKRKSNFFQCNKDTILEIDDEKQIIVIQTNEEC